ncbi:DNA-binding transcriptional regulator of glucitol operon [Actinoalloteichus cyanogriseus DSM 43889]|uniref:DNA-binding transcriptional regulator of glucitol operon n=1 Tax=Actinoalloteichus caeruleus DSM 43889 TaxID=1120930 RepID=A0ABT1JBK8_ACTCY|nr:DNA-binding transcriptional regulator of glucitol operon [Actinoalloteichus caeruleus DSM 43889]
MLHLLTLVIVLASFRLGWWQWDRFQSIDGRGLNLGYTVLWPFIGVFTAYVWWRLLRMEAERADPASPQLPVVLEDGGERADEAEGTAPSPRVSARAAAAEAQLARLRSGSEPRTHENDRPAQDHEAGLTEYNEYLAALRRADERPGSPAQMEAT